MLFPLRTDQFPRRPPLVTQGLIVLNVGVYLAGLLGPRFDAFEHAALVDWGHFDPREFKFWQLLTSQFLHDPSSIWHLAFNMLALWVFGPPVEGRLGRVGFLGFYLIAGVVANLAHMMVESAPVIGASGAIAGVTGIFLALFPRSHVICFYVLAGGLIMVSSLWLIGLYFTVNLLSQVNTMIGGPERGIAYMAHLAGYVYGFATGFALLGLKIIPRGEFDIFFLFRQWRRRAALRATNRGSASGAWESASADTSARLAQQKRRDPDEGLNERDAAIANQRAEIHRLLAAHDLPAAARVYLELTKSEPDVVLSEQRQLDIANQLASEHEHAAAARAYELLLTHHPRSHAADQVRLLLGMLYARTLQRPQRARELVAAARDRLGDDTQKRLADQLLAEIDGGRV